MKKAFILLCGLLLVSGVYGAGSQMNFGLNFGVMTDDSFSFDPLMWTVGAELDLQFERFPDVQSRSDAGRQRLQVQGIPPLSGRYAEFHPGKLLCRRRADQGLLSRAVALLSPLPMSL